MAQMDLAGKLIWIKLKLDTKCRLLELLTPKPNHLKPHSLPKWKRFCVITCVNTIKQLQVWAHKDKPEGMGGGEQISRKGLRTGVGARLQASASPLWRSRSIISWVHVVPYVQKSYKKVSHSLKDISSHCFKKEYNDKFKTSCRLHCYMRVSSSSNRFYYNPPHVGTRLLFYCCPLPIHLYHFPF